MTKISAACAWYNIFVNCTLRQRLCGSCNIVSISLSSSQGDKKFLDRGGDGGHTIVYSVLKQSGVQEESQCTDVCRSAERVAIGNARKEAAHAHRTLGNAHWTLGIPRHVRFLHHVS